MKIIIKQLLYIAFVVPLLLQAQFSVSGTITDTEASLPLPGVNISILGTARGAVTDFNGEFKIEPVTVGQILVFDYLGFKTKKLVYNGEETLNVSLDEDVSQLSEVILIGYGSSQEKDITGAIATVSEKEFNKGAILSPEQLLTAKTPGVRITTDGGAPGAGSQIRIRGGSSLSGNNDPLIVVDGVPLDQRGVQGVRNQLNAINPNDIKDFVVLKDAASTAIYGSRASNGVILITTKAGKKESPLTVQFDVKSSFSSPTRTIDLLNSNPFDDPNVELTGDELTVVIDGDRVTNIPQTNQFREFVRENSDNPDAQLALLGTSNTDWQDQIFQDATGQIYNLSLAKGFKSTTLRGSFNHANQDGILRTDNYQRNAASLNITQDLFNNNLKLRFNNKISQDKNRFANNDAIGNALRFDPTQAVRNDDGSFFEFGESNAPVNPLSSLLEDDNRGENRRIISNFNIDYSIPYVSGLNLNVNLGLDYAENEGRRLQSGQSGLRVSNPVDLNNQFSGINRNKLVDAVLNYKKDITQIKTKIDATLGYSFQEFFQRSNEDVNEGDIQTILRSDINRNRLLSYFGRVSFDIDDKYLLSSSFRRDASSRFSEENRVGIFPGISVGWKLHNESFFKKIKFINEFKIRGGIGITGQQEIESSFAFLPVFEPSDNASRVQFGNEFVSTLRPGPFNNQIKWEETTNRNIGLDYGFLNGRISGSIDFYSKDTKDLLIQGPPPAGANLSDLVFANTAKTSNRGVEFAIDADIFRTDNFNWNLAYNITYNKNEIVSLSQNDTPDSQLPQGGIAGGTGNNIQVWRPGFDPTTFLVFRQVYNSDGRPIEGAYVDVNGDNSITDEDLVPTKKAAPDVFMGLTSTMNYKELDFTFTFRGNFGGYNYNNVRSELANTSSALTTPGNFVNNTHSDVLFTGFRGQELFSDYYLESSDFVRLDNVSIGYTFEFNKVQLRLSATGTNLFTITDYSGLDPEVLVGLNSGIDNNSYPRPRTYVFGVNVKF